MNLAKKRILSILCACLLVVVCFGFVGCENSKNELTVTGADKLEVTVGQSMSDALSKITLTYTPPTSTGAAAETFTGLEQMLDAGVNVMWSGSHEELKLKDEPCYISFAYKGATLSITYKVK